MPLALQEMRSKTMVSLAGKPPKAGTKPYIFRGFRRNVLTSEVGEKWFENGLREPARPCCFPVLRPRFLRSTRLSSMVSTALAWKPP